MKIEYNEGCTVTGFVGKELDYKQALRTIVNSLSEEDAYSLLEETVKLFGNSEAVYDCEQCGDTVFSYTLEVKDVLV